MSEEKVRAIEALNSWREGGSISTEFVFDSLLKYVTKKVQDATLIKSPKPQLIQGYTSKQWQEIIDGGYLVEVRDFETQPWVPARLTGFRGNKEHGFHADGTEDEWSYCRPAQLKGVMRPIFVEPVGKHAKCIFFNSHNDVLGPLPWYDKPIFSKIEHATKYIEV